MDQPLVIIGWSKRELVPYQAFELLNSRCGGEFWEAQWSVHSNRRRNNLKVDSQRAFPRGNGRRCWLLSHCSEWLRYLPECRVSLQFFQQVNQWIVSSFDREKWFYEAQALTIASNKRS